jgi:GGDEF domain-containing protein
VPQRGDIRRLVKALHPDLLDPATSWYRRWYFVLRLAEEVERADRYAQPLAVMTITLPRTVQTMLYQLHGRVAEWLGSVADEALRVSDFPGVLAPDELAVFLPHAGRDVARRIATRVALRLESLTPVIGIAAFPEDGRGAEDLLAAARRRASGGFGRITDLRAYRERRWPRD